LLGKGNAGNCFPIFYERNLSYLLQILFESDQLEHLNAYTPSWGISHVDGADLELVYIEFSVAFLQRSLYYPVSIFLFKKIPVQLPTAADISPRLQEPESWMVAVGSVLRASITPVREAKLGIVFTFQFG
jgi:hypothetical protein